jgi:hypothetical protein
MRVTVEARMAPMMLETSDNGNASIGFEHQIRLPIVPFGIA